MEPSTRKIVAGVLIAAGVTSLGAVAVYAARRQGLLGALPAFGDAFTRPGRRPRIVSRTQVGDKVITHYRARDIPINDRVQLIQDPVYKSIEKDPGTRELATKLISGCKSRDNMCEAQAIYDAVRKRVRYIGDVAPIKFPDGAVEPIDFFQSARRTWEMGAGDCLPKGTLLLVEGHRFVAIENLLPGTKIWGRDAWTPVKDVWAKGVLPVDAVFLNNGSSFKATPDHKVFVALCGKHTDRVKPCSCPIEDRAIERILVSQLKPGMVLVQPDTIASGSEYMDPRRAFIEGLYLSDGFTGHDTSFDISGQDSSPKEAQKREVEALCTELGIRTTWQRKYINIQDKAWTERLKMMGTRAWHKHALSLDLQHEAAAELLRGIMADSGANTNGDGRTFTTTSRELMLQTRLLYRMLGVSCSERYIVDHGGLGEHPIWRLGVRDQSVKKAEKLLRVKAIERAVMELPVYDISTEDHYVYLPEADVVVSNCDDHVTLIASLLSVVGIPARLRVTAPTRTADWGHIYPIAGFPVESPKKWVALDTTLEAPTRMGHEVRFGRNLDYKPYTRDLPA